MKNFIKIVLGIVAAVSTAYMVYSLLKRYYPQAVRRYYTSTGMNEIKLDD